VDHLKTRISRRDVLFPKHARNAHHPKTRKGRDDGHHHQKFNQSKSAALAER
jgi:hypothetical protein